jgi:hypothetical protein
MVVASVRGSGTIVVFFRRTAGAPMGLRSGAGALIDVAACRVRDHAGAADAHARRHEQRHQQSQGYRGADHASPIGTEKGDHSFNIGARARKVNTVRRPGRAPNRGLGARHSLLEAPSTRRTDAEAQKSSPEIASPPLRVASARMTCRLMLLVRNRQEPSMNRKLPPPVCAEWKLAGLPLGELTVYCRL